MQLPSSAVNLRGISLTVLLLGFNIIYVFLFRSVKRGTSTIRVTKEKSRPCLNETLAQESENEIKSAVNRIVEESKKADKKH